MPDLLPKEVWVFGVDTPSGGSFRAITMLDTDDETFIAVFTKHHILEKWLAEIVPTGITRINEEKKEDEHVTYERFPLMYIIQCALIKANVDYLAVDVSNLEDDYTILYLKDRPSKN